MKDNQIMQIAQKRRAELLEAGVEWPENIFLPHNELVTTVVKSYSGSVSRDLASQVMALAVKGPWRYTKSIYKFDLTLLESLVETGVKGDIPVDLLTRLPEWSLYIEDLKLFVGLDICEGITILCLSAETPERGELPIYLPLIKGETLEQAFDDFTDDLIKSVNAASRTIDTSEIKVMAEVSKGFLAKVLPVIMYICSDGVEYSGTGRPNDYRPSPVKTKKGWKLFPAEKTRTWKLGFKTGEAIREGRKQTRTSGERKGPAPHIRRAHWHTFRNGAVKFLPPIPVAHNRG
jgi:hypothetical protein